jgi:HK97 family phage major capsid protein
MVKYSFQEAEDADDFEQFIHDLAFVRAARAIEYSLTLGKDSGSNTQLPSSISGGWLAGLTAGVTQMSGELSAGPTYAQLTALAGSVDHSYYVNGAFMASPSVFNFLVAQVTTTGAPLYNFDDDGNLLIAGKKLWVNAAMPAYNAASSTIVAFGDYSRSLAYLNGGGVQIRILKERFADTLEGAALIHTRLGSAALLPGAVKALVTAAS